MAKKGGKEEILLFLGVKYDFEKKDNKTFDNITEHILYL